MTDKTMKKLKKYVVSIVSAEGPGSKIHLSVAVLSAESSKIAMKEAIKDVDMRGQIIMKTIVKV